MSGLSVSASVAGRGLDVDLHVAEGTVVALVGPNGAGKTSLLQLVVGLLRPTSGRVEAAGRVLSDLARSVPVHRRRVAMLTQRTPLFPHLTVAENVAFGPRAAGLSRSAAARRAAAELDAVGCSPFAGRAAYELSGGEAQRVAIARALATDPDVVLLDEPMVGLDVTAAAEVRQTLARRLRGRTTLLVSHDALDIWTIADQVAVLDSGRVVGQGPVDEMMTRPVNPFVAQLSGMNLLTGTGRSGALEIAPGISVHGLDDPDQPLSPGAPGLARIAPDAVSLHLKPPDGSPRNVLEAVVVGLEPRGAVVRVTTAVGSQSVMADITSESAARLGLAPGTAVWAVIKATQVRLYGR